VTHSIITASLIASYRATNYLIGTGSDTISVQIDRYSQPLQKLLTASQYCNAAIVSAYNPHSRHSSDEDNSAHHEQLRNLLRLCGYPFIEGLNVDQLNQWPDEESFCILGLDLNTARSLGQQFNQNAIVWIAEDAIPRLILLR